MQTQTNVGGEKIGTEPRFDPHLKKNTDPTRGGVGSVKFVRQVDPIL